MIERGDIEKIVNRAINEMLELIIQKINDRRHPYQSERERMQGFDDGLTRAIEQVRALQEKEN